jgi:catechol 2,3-dioxygenase-like lactoylglutathione lyase family enzyme
MTYIPAFRVARPSDNLDALLPFYLDGLGLEILFHFHDHDGFDGIMLGRPGWPYHLEFTHRLGHAAGRAPTEDNLLVLYYPEEPAWRQAVQRMSDAGFLPVKACNPYWDRSGCTFEDPDGYRIVLQNEDWAL